MIKNFEEEILGGFDDMSCNYYVRKNIKTLHSVHLVIQLY